MEGSQIILESESNLALTCKAIASTSKNFQKFAGENKHSSQTLPLMDFQKAKIYLDKLNREFTRMSKDQENTIRIDVDIMASYIRELYDAILSESNTYVAPKEEYVPVYTPQYRSPIAVPPVEIAPVPPPSPVKAEIPPPAPAAPVEVPQPAAVPAAAVEVPRPAPVPASTTTSAIGLDVLFEEKLAKELSEKLAEAPIADLKKAIALNDRLMYTSELFAGDGKLFENALSALNSFTRFEEAKDYLVQFCAVHYAWTDKKRLESAKAFVKLVRRRYK